MSFYSFQGRVRAPEFKKNLVWYNTAAPLELQKLRGKIVLLDFWTYCCINCMHILPDLKKLERRYSDQLVVIGVHSPKFENEKVEKNVQQAILRYQIEHPVVCDPDMSQWQAFGVRAWPTIALVDPEGYVVGLWVGEGNLEILNAQIADLIEEGRAKNKLNETPLHFQREAVPQNTLCFPGKVWADPQSDLIYLSDSNHHRILVLQESGEVIDTIGSGKEGAGDGRFEVAEFSQPQGIVKVGDLLYIADTENHLLREANLKTRTVQTLAGTGKQALQFNQAGIGTKVALNSPWDLVALPPLLYIAMAGSHQVWTYHLKTQELKPFAGSGREACIDGPLRYGALAQPSGITTDGQFLYVADSEVSAIRRIGLGLGGSIETLLGHDLFVFGDRDGIGESVLLQHPLGVSYQSGFLYLADTYNHKVKQLNLKTLSCETVFGSTSDVHSELIPEQLFEPGGISMRGSQGFVADTNHHRLIRFETLGARQVMVKEVTIK